MSYLILYRSTLIYGTVLHVCIPTVYSNYPQNISNYRCLPRLYFRATYEVGEDVKQSAHCGTVLAGHNSTGQLEGTGDCPK